MKRLLISLLIILPLQIQAGRYHPGIDYIFPLPDSDLLPVRTTVILRIADSERLEPNDLSGLITADTESGSVKGSVFLAGDQKTVIFKPDHPLHDGQTVSVTVNLPSAGIDAFQYSFRTMQNSVNRLSSLPAKASGMFPNRSASDVRLINGVAVPADFPVIQTHIYGETAPGRIFFACTGPWGGYGNYIIICENDGTPYFYRRYAGIPRTGNLTVHANGELSFHCYEIFDIVLDHTFTEVDTIHPGHGYMADDHEMQILENGHKLLVARDHILIDMSKIVTGGRSDATVEGHHLEELDQYGNVIFEWRAWDHLDIRDTYVDLHGQFIDFVHMNSAAIDFDGNVIISVREYKMVVKIDRNTGETIWTFGGRDSDFRLLNDDLWFSFQHDVRPVPGKPNHYTLFDNGRERYPQFSRAVEYALDTTAMTAEKVWEYRHNPDWFSSYMGGVQRLDID